jgi:hypothetical protein
VVLIRIGNLLIHEDTFFGDKEKRMREWGMMGQRQDG